MRNPCKNFFYENKNYIKLSLAIAALSVLAGAAAFYYRPEVIKYIIAIFQEKFGADTRIGWKLVMEIFQANMAACLAAMLGGVFFGVLPLLMAAFNFFAIGVVAAFFLVYIPAGFGYKALFLSAALLPHGILEAPAILLSCALGFRLGWRWLLPKNSGIRVSVLRQDVVLVLKTAPFLVTAIFAAAVIEVFVTGNLLQWLSGKV